MRFCALFTLLIWNHNFLHSQLPNQLFHYDRFHSWWVNCRISAFICVHFFLLFQNTFSFSLSVDRWLQPWVFYEGHLLSLLLFSQHSASLFWMTGELIAWYTHCGWQLMSSAFLVMGMLFILWPQVFLHTGFPIFTLFYLGNPIMVSYKVVFSTFLQLASSLNKTVN